MQTDNHLDSQFFKNLGVRISASHFDSDGSGSPEGSRPDAQLISGISNLNPTAETKSCWVVFLVVCVACLPIVALVVRVTFGLISK